MAYSPESAEQDAARVPESDGDRAVAYRNVLDVARERPDASPEAVADEVDDVSTPFVERVFEEFGDPTGGGRRCEGSGDPTAERSAGGASEETGRDRVAALEERVERLESAVADRSASTATGDVETVRQRLHACLDADHISRDAELRIVRRVVHETEGA